MGLSARLQEGGGRGVFSPNEMSTSSLCHTLILSDISEDTGHCMSELLKNERQTFCTQRARSHMVLVDMCVLTAHYNGRTKNKGRRSGCMWIHGREGYEYLYIRF